MSALKVGLYTFFLLILFSFSGSVSQQKSLGIAGGIVFSGNHQRPVINAERAKKLNPDKISSLHLTKDEQLDLNPIYSISFTASFWYNFTSGNLLTVQNPAYKLNLKYFAPENCETVSLKLTLNDKPMSLEFPLKKSEIYEGNRFNIRVAVDESKGKISLTINNKEKTFNTTPFITSDESDLYMGASPGENECAPMIVENLLIHISGKLEHKYIFNEMEGDIAYDSEGSLDAFATNHQWSINQHFFWNYHDSISYKKQDFNRIWQNPYTNELGIITNNGVDVYSFKDGSLSRTKYEEQYKVMVSIGGFPNHDLLVGFCSAYPDDEVAVFDFKKGKLTGGLTKNTDEGYVYGSTNLVDSKTKSVYSFCGYGWYKARNQLMKFNESSKKWEEQKVKGDFFPARYMQAVLPSPERDVYYILGGYGNKSGIQKDGFYNLWDLHKLDLKTLTNTKIYDWGKKDKYHVFYQALWADSNRSGIYTLVQSTEEKVIEQKLGKLAFGDTSLTIVGDTGSVGSHHPLSGSFLIDYKMNKFFSVLTTEYDSTVTVHLFSINTPILSEAEYKELYSISPHGVRSRRLEWSQWGIALAALVLLPYASVSIFKYRKKRKVKSSMQIEHQKLELLKTVKEPEKVLITLFGGLKIFDSNGLDVARQLTPKQYETISLIAYYSYKGVKKIGIEFDQIDKIIWHDTPVENLRNSRNALLSKIRAALKGVNGISLKVYDTSVELSANDNYVNEINSYFLLKRYFSNKEKISDEESFDNFLKIVRRGKLMENLSADWVEKIKMEEDSEITKIITIHLETKFSEGHYEKCVEITDSISSHDPLNEELLGIKLRSLYNLGRHSIALEVYNNFCNKYQSFFGERFAISFNDLLKY